MGYFPSFVLPTPSLLIPVFCILHSYALPVWRYAISTQPFPPDIAFATMRVTSLILSVVVVATAELFCDRPFLAAIAPTVFGMEFVFDSD